MDTMVIVMIAIVLIVCSCAVCCCMVATGVGGYFMFRDSPSTTTKKPSKAPAEEEEEETPEDESPSAAPSAASPAPAGPCNTDVFMISGNEIRSGSTTAPYLTTRTPASCTGDAYVLDPSSGGLILRLDDTAKTIVWQPALTTPMDTTNTTGPWYFKLFDGSAGFFTAKTGGDTLHWDLPTQYDKYKLMGFTKNDTPCTKIVLTSKGNLRFENGSGNMMFAAGNKPSSLKYGDFLVSTVDSMNEIVSPNGNVKLTMQTNGQLVLTKKTGTGVAATTTTEWTSSNAADSTNPQTKQFVAIFQKDTRNNVAEDFYIKSGTATSATGTELWKATGPTTTTSGAVGPGFTNATTQMKTVTEIRVTDAGKLEFVNAAGTVVFTLPQPTGAT